MCGIAGIIDLKGRQVKRSLLERLCAKLVHRGRPISVGCYCCLGSEVRVAPGTVVPPFCIVALGSVLSGQRRGGPVFGPPRSLIGGNPAAVVRTLRECELFLVTRKTRNDIPDDVASALLPDDLRAAARRAQGVIEVEGACPVD